MIYPHPIRLRPPWQCSVIEDGVRFQRHFNCPTGLDPREQVWLVLDAVVAAGTAYCNESLLGPVDADAGGAEFNLTQLLRPRNLLHIDLRARGPVADVEMLGPVRLEIRLGPVDAANLDSS